MKVCLIPLPYSLLYATNLKIEIIFQVKKNEKVEWCWKKVKQGGAKPTERISSSMVTLHDETAILFGGVHDMRVSFDLVTLPDASYLMTTDFFVKGRR